MARPERGLYDLYRAAHQVGDQLLDLLRAPLSAAAMERAEQLVQEREGLLEAAAAQIQAGAGTGASGALADLERLLAQQQQLERHMHDHLALLLQASVRMGQTRGHLASTRRLLRPEQRSRLMDERR